MRGVGYILDRKIGCRLRQRSSGGDRKGRLDHHPGIAVEIKSRRKNVVGLAVDRTEQCRTEMSLREYFIITTLLFCLLCRRKPAGDFEFTAHHGGIAAIDREVHSFEY